MKNKYGCALLAGGKGSRMGHRNKAELKYGNKSFLEHISKEINKELESGLVSKCYLSVAEYEQQTPSGWIGVPDEDETKGPMGGIKACLKRAEADGLDGVFFVPCDAPFFDRSVHEKLAAMIEEDTDAVCFRTSDGKIQTTFGWYSIKMIPVLEEAIRRGHLKLTGVLEEVKFLTVDAKTLGQDEKLFANFNTEAEYGRLTAKGAEIKQHILISGPKQAGKTTIIKRVMEELSAQNVPLYGYQSRIMRIDEEGKKYTYIYPAGKIDARMEEGNLIGCSRNKVLGAYHEVFDTYGRKLVCEAKPDGVLIMDEIGFMEIGADLFCRAVVNAFDEDVHILGSIKNIEDKYRYLDTIRAHNRAEIIELTPENREEVYERVRQIVASWDFVREGERK